MNGVIAVTGASGGIGKALVNSLVGKWHLRGLFRTKSVASEAFAQAGGEVVFGDLENIQALRALCQNADTIIHCAAKILSFSRADFLKTNVDGTRQIARIAVREHCRRFIHLSSNAVYAATAPGQPFSEDSSLVERETLDAYSLSKLRSERAVVEELAPSQTDFTIVRPTCVYGPGIASWTLIPLKSIIKGRPLFMGLEGIPGMMDAVYIDDLVRAIESIITHPKASRQTFNIGGQLVSYSEFYSHLGFMAQRDPKLGNRKSLEKLEKASALLGARTANFRNSIQSVIAMSSNIQPFPHSKATEVLGYKPKHSLALGMLRTEQWLREAGHLKSPRQIRSNDGHFTILPVAASRPANQHELSQIVAYCDSGNLPIKAIGKLHSFVQIPSTAGVIISTEKLNRIINLSDFTVTVEAGVTFAQLNTALYTAGKSLAIQGSNPHQTIAGAIAVGTHGGSLRHGTISDLVTKIRLTKVSGEIVDIDSSHPDFWKVVVSLGLPGVTAEITLSIVPAFSLKSEVMVKPFDWFLENFDTVHQKNEYVDARYYPSAHSVEIMVANTCAPTTSSCLQSKNDSTLKNQLRSFIGRKFFEFYSKLPSGIRSRASSNSVGKFYVPKQAPAHEVFNYAELTDCVPFSIDDVEVAIPYENAVRALKEVARYYKSSTKPRFFPVHIRCSKASKHILAPNYFRDVCWFEFWEYPADKTFYNDLETLFRQFHYRPHWAKQAPLNPKYLRNQYSEWIKFEHLRREYDSKGLLMNQYLEGIFT